MRTAIVIEPGSEVLTIAELGLGHDGIELDRHLIRSLPPEGLDSDWLQRLWQKEHLNSNRVICLIPSQLVHYHTVVVPVLPDEQLEAAVRMELETGSDLHGVHQVKPIYHRLKDRMYHVRTAVIPDQPLTELHELLERAGLVVLWSGLRNWGNENFLNYRRDFFGEPAAAVAYLDITSEQTELGVVQNEKLVYCRNFLPGGLQLKAALEAAATGGEVLENQAAQPVVIDFWEQFQLSRAAYQGSNGLTLPEPVWLLGETEDFSELLRDSAAGAGVSLRFTDETRSSSRSGHSDPRRVAVNVQLDGGSNRKFISRLAPLLGLGLDALGFYNHETRRIYSTRQQKTRIQKERWHRIAAAGAAAGLLLIGLGLGVQAEAVKEAKIEQWLGEQSRCLQQLKLMENQTGAALHRMRSLEGWLQDQDLELKWLGILEDNLPEGTVITDLTIEDDMIKDLAVTAPAASLVLKRMRQVPELEGLKLKGTIMTVNGGESFHLEGPIIIHTPGTGSTQKKSAPKDKETHD